MLDLVSLSENIGACFTKATKLSQSTNLLVITRKETFKGVVLGIYETVAFSFYQFYIKKEFFVIFGFLHNQQSFQKSIFGYRR